MTCSTKLDKVTRRNAARRLNQIFSRYCRLDVDDTTSKGATKVRASWAVQLTAFDTLADRPVGFPDKPTKREAANALKWFLVDVPNNLSVKQVKEALALLNSMAI